MSERRAIAPDAEGGQLERRLRDVEWAAQQREGVTLLDDSGPGIIVDGSVDTLRHPFQIIYWSDTEMYAVREGGLSVWNATAREMQSYVLSRDGDERSASQMVWWVALQFTDGEPGEPVLHFATGSGSGMQDALDLVYLDMAEDNEMRWLIGFVEAGAVITQCQFGNIIVPRIS